MKIILSLKFICLVFSWLTQIVLCAPFFQWCRDVTTTTPTSSDITTWSSMQEGSAEPRCHDVLTNQECNYKITGLKRNIALRSDNNVVASKIQVIPMVEDQNNVTLLEDDLMLFTDSSAFKLHQAWWNKTDLYWKLLTLCLLPGYTETVIFSLSQRLDPICSCGFKRVTISVLEPKLVIRPRPKNGTIIVKSRECYPDIRNVTVIIASTNAGTCVLFTCNISYTDAGTVFTLKTNKGKNNHRTQTSLEGINYNKTYGVSVNCSWADRCFPYKNYSGSKSFDIKFSDTLLCTSTKPDIPTSSTLPVLLDQAVNKQITETSRSLTTNPERTYIHTTNETMTKRTNIMSTSATVENTHVFQKHTRGQQESMIEYLLGDPVKIAGISIVAGAIVGVPLSAAVYYRVRKRHKTSSIVPSSRPT